MTKSRFSMRGLLQGTSQGKMPVTYTTTARQRQITPDLRRQQHVGRLDVRLQRARRDLPTLPLFVAENEINERVLRSV